MLYGQVLSPHTFPSLMFISTQAYNYNDYTTHTFPPESGAKKRWSRWKVARWHLGYLRRTFTGRAQVTKNVCHPHHNFSYLTSPTIVVTCTNIYLFPWQPRGGSLQKCSPFGWSQVISKSPLLNAASVDENGPNVVTLQQGAFEINIGLVRLKLVYCIHRLVVE